MHGCESLHVESVAVKEVFKGQTVSTQMNTILLWAMYGTAIAVMANLMAFLTYLLLNDQDDWGKQLMITAKARIRAWKSRSHRMSVATFRFIAKRNALTHGATGTAIKTRRWLYSKSRQSIRRKAPSKSQSEAKHDQMSIDENRAP